MRTVSHLSAQTVGVVARVLRSGPDRDPAAVRTGVHVISPQRCPVAVGRTSQPFSSAKRSASSTSFFEYLARLGVTPASIRVRRSESVAQTVVPMRLPGPLIGGARAVAAQHLTALPSRQAHQVALVAALGQPGVGERVAQHVGVEAVDAGLPPAL